jgi:ATP-dependent protease ClpP protease subunit
MNNVPKIKVIGEITADTFEKYVDQASSQYEFPIPWVLISSPGGDIGYTLAMLDDIDEHKRVTYATGICQSAAAVLATAGDGLRICTMDALFRFIPPEKEQVLVDGEWVEKVPDLRYFLHSVLVARLAQRLKWAIPETNDLFDGEFINSERAKELGLIDKVISTEKPNGNLSRVSGCETGAYHAENA